VKWLLQHACAALFLDPGLGKTSITLDAIMRLMKHGGVKKVLVIAPLRPCYAVWSHADGGELSKWDNFAGLRVSLLHGKGKDAAVAADADLYVVNPDALKWLVEKGHLETLLKNGVDTLVIDELSKFKHASTQRFKKLKPYLGRFKRRWGLTGSPASNGLLDLFGQAYVLDLGRALGTRITHYRFNYFLPTGYGGYTWVPQDGAEEAIFERLKDVALSMKATDHLDLPDLVESNIWVELPTAARKVYDELEDDLITSLDRDTVTAVNTAVASMKCRQVASGGIYTDRDPDEPWAPRKTAFIHDEKTEALCDLVEELQGSPLLVAYEFQHDLERIRAGLARIGHKNVPFIGGGVDMKTSLMLAQKWNRGELPILVGHPQAMGHGLNLQAAGHHVAFYTTTWDFELYDQLIRRVWRQGNKNERVMVHRILARKTVDEDVIKALAAKKRGQGALFDALKARVRGRRSS